jgi:hypothetical protein
MDVPYLAGKDDQEDYLGQVLSLVTKACSTISVEAFMRGRFEEEGRRPSLSLPELVVTSGR